MLLTSADEQSLTSCASNMTLVLPAISVGNVGQLAVDLLISSLDLELVGHSPANKFTLPLVGPGAYIQPGSKQLSTAVEVYSNKEKTLLVVQQRSDFISHTRKEFLDSLVEWIVKMNFGRVVLLGSAFLSSQMDNFFQSSESEKIRRFLTKSGPGVFPSVDSFEQQMITSQFDDPKSLRGAGISSALFQKLLDERNIALLVLVKLCNEGEDNVADAVAMVDLLNNFLSLRPKDTMRPPSSVLDQFYSLAELDNEKRLAAVHSFVSQDLSEHRTYCLERLIGGLSSSRAAARLGFTTALTELLRKEASHLSCDEIFELGVKKLTPPKDANENPSAAAIGHYLLCLSMLASDAFAEDLPKIAGCLQELKTKHRFLSTACTQGILRVSEKMDKSTFKDGVWPLLAPTLTVPLAAHTPDSLWLLLGLRAKFSSIMSKRVDFLNKDGSLKLTEADYPVLVDLLKKPDPMTIHPVLACLVDYGRESDTFEQLYKEVIEQWAFLGDDYKVTQRGFEVASKILSRSDLTDKEIVAVFSKNLVTKMEAALKSSVEQQFLGDLIKRLIDHLLSAINASEMSQKHLIRLLERCDQMGTIGFDHLTGTKLAESILAKLNARGVTKLLANMETDAQPFAIRRLLKIFQATSDKEVRILLLTKLAAWCKQSEQKEVCSTVFGGCAESLLVVSVRPGKARIELSSDNLQLLMATVTAIVGSEQQHEQYSGALKVLNQMIDKEGNVARGFAVLTVYLLLWALTEQEGEGNGAHIQEVLMCWKRFLKPVEGEPKYVEVLIDLLLQLLSKPQRYIRAVVQTVFRYIADEISIDTLTPILDTLNASDSEALTGEDDGDEFAPIDGLPMEGDEEGESDASSGSEASDDDGDDDEEEDEAANGVDPELVGSLKKALGNAAVEDESDAESVLSDVSDTTMLRLDEGLAAAFRTHLSKSPANRKDVAAQARIFRTKCFDLLLILVNVTNSKALILDLLIPLIKTANDALKRKGQDMAFDKANSLLDIICKTKKWDASEAELMEVFDALVVISPTVLNPVLQATVGNVAGFLFGLGAYDGGACLEAMRKKHNGLLSKFFEDRECHVLGDIISAPIIRYPELAFDTLPILLEYAFNDEIRIFRRTEALSWSIAFFRKDLLVTDDKHMKKTWHKYAKRLADRMCELLTATAEDAKLLKPRYFAESMRLLFVFSTLKGNPHITQLAENNSLVERLESLTDPKLWKEDLAKASGAIHKAIGKAPHKIAQQIVTALNGPINEEPPVKRKK